MSVTTHLIRPLVRLAGSATLTVAVGVAALAGPAVTSAALAPLVLGTHATPAGTVLATPAGLTLYTLGSDTATRSTCDGGCAAAWPPLTLAAGQIATGGTGVGGTFTVLTRSDGSRQVVYNGKPLYTWQGDGAPGDATGQGVGGFSVARPAAARRPATAIQAAIHAGTSHSGTFVTGRTITVPNGSSVTVRFHLGTKFAGKSIAILRATRSSLTAPWSTYGRIATVKVDAKGFAYRTIAVRGWAGFRATYAGDAANGPGTSPSVVAHGV
jgi:predicted lipoprotein with Yx(FWY)xxD motif